MAESYQLEGRVAAILNARELVINIGLISGVKSGQKFAVLAATPMRIVDPITKAELDVVDREKVRVEAHEVRDRVTICRTYRLKEGEDVSSFSFFRQLTTRSPETLRIDDDSAPPPLSEEESYVKINDRVISVND